MADMSHCGMSTGSDLTSCIYCLLILRPDPVNRPNTRAFERKEAA